MPGKEKRILDKRAPKSVSRLAMAAMYTAALALIGIGVWHIDKPSAAIVVGGLLWLDLTMGAMRK